jgi:integrase
VFGTERGGPFTPDVVNRLVKRIGERARFAFPIHAHMLRHWPMPNTTRDASTIGSAIDRSSTPLATRN